MVSKRVGSKDIDGSATGAAVERMSTSLSIYEDIKLIIDKDINFWAWNPPIVGFGAQSPSFDQRWCRTPRISSVERKVYN